MSADNLRREETIVLQRRLILQALGALAATTTIGRKATASEPPSAAGTVKPTREQMIRFLRESNEVGKRAMSMGHHPFGAVLVGPDNKTILMTQCNLGTVYHAEATLARIASDNYPADHLWNCTLYTAVEPCCMCSGTIYWANIGRVVYGMAEKQLLQLTKNNRENPTMSLPASYVFQHGQKAIELIGPVKEVMDETVALHKAFWQSKAG